MDLLAVMLEYIIPMVVFATLIGLAVLVGHILPQQLSAEQSRVVRQAEALGWQHDPTPWDGPLTGFRGHTSDGIAWEIRTRGSVDPTNDPEGGSVRYTISWSTDSVQLEPIALFVVSAGVDRREWNYDGLLLDAQAHEPRLRALENIYKEIARGSTAAAPGEIERRMQQLGFGRPRMLEFHDAAHEVPLHDPALREAYTALSVDEAIIANVLRPVEAALLRWHQDVGVPQHGELWIWLGGPNLRMQAGVTEFHLAAYERLVDLGIALARAYRGMGR